MKRYSEDLALYVECPYVVPRGMPHEMILYFTVINSAGVDINKIGVGLNFDIGHLTSEESNMKYGKKLLAIENQIEFFEEL